jgi:hypothetical protein
MASWSPGRGAKGPESYGGETVFQSVPASIWS